MRLSGRLVLVLSFVAASPVVDATPTPNEWAAFSPAQRARDVKGDQSFAAKLYKAQSLPATTNLFFSPASVRIAVGMAYAGARGTTATEIADVLELDPARDVTARLFGQLLRDWNHAGSSLRVANRAWGQRDYKFLSGFLTTLSRDYHAPFGTVDFVGDTEGARRTINQWVDVTTEHKIRDLIQPGVLSERTALVLTNAVYFKENWATPFVRTQTFDSSFYAPSGEVHVPMMWKTDKVRFARIAGAKVIKLGYASGERSMIVVLPERPNGLESWERSLDAATM
ncbi:MAG: serpin family protein, partial [Myxococcales bacterium]